MVIGVGEIAFVAAQSDNNGGGFNGDAFQFVLLVPVTAGTTIFFTDGGYRTDTGTFRTNETMVRWVAQSNLPAGTVVTFLAPGGVGAASSAEWTGINPSTGAALTTAAFQLATTNGDNITALINPTFGGIDALTGTAIAQITYGGATFAATFDITSGNNHTALAPGLTDGVNAVSLAVTDNVRYNEAAAGSVESGTLADVRASINNDANWTSSATPLSPHNHTTGTFTTQSVVSGTTGSETVTGTAGNDTINGLDGNDVLLGGGGEDNFNGGTGNDIIVVDSAGDVVTEAANEGIDRVETNLAAYTLTANVENLEYTGGAAFTGTGNTLANTIVGGASGDALDGGDGDDTLGGEAGDDSLVGGNGNDRLIGGAGTDTLSGGAGNDTLVVDSDAEVGLATGGDGIDTLQLNYSSNGSATIAGDIETVSNIGGGTANLFLNALANTYGGGAGSDNVSAGDGNDVLYGRGGSDALNGQEGNDRIFGDAGDDVLGGENGSDLLYGGADTDTLYGGGGNDTLYGEAGNDILEGGAGLDILNGGLGADTFRFSAGDTGATVATADRIQGYSSAQGDQIDLSALGVTSFIGTAAFGNVAGEVRTQVINGNTFVQGDVDGDGVADFMIRLDGIISLTADDLVFGGLN